MRRAFVEPEVLTAAADQGWAELSPEATHYIARVLRLEPGESVELFDGTGRVLRGALGPGEPPRVRGTVEQSPDGGLPPLIVAQARVRGPKLDDVIRRATELGGSALWVFEAARCQGRGAGGSEGRWARWEKIASEAARQSGRTRIPTLEGPLSFEALLERISAFDGVAAVGDPESARPLSAALGAAGDAGVLLVVGPEGGLDARELDRLAEAGAKRTRWGAHVLRTETAALAALAAAQVALGRF